MSERVTGFWGDLREHLAEVIAMHEDGGHTGQVGGSRPEQLKENAQASGVKLDDDLWVKIDEILDPVVERDPSGIDVFEKRP